MFFSGTFLPTTSTLLKFKMAEVIPFSFSSRETIFNRITAEPLDVLIIGGGITGAGIALDMASRGLRVGLAEKQDFAEGTSSRSTKLIHGGLRYLKQFEIGLVREVGLERAMLHKNAPHLVTPEHMLLPVIKGGSLSPFTTSIALLIYEWLAGVRKEEQRIMLSKKQTADQEPLLNKEILKAGAIYYEYRTDDARLVIEVLKTANAYGARSLNYTEVVDFMYENGKLTGAKLKDLLTGREVPVKAKYIVNAAGPWVDKLRDKDHSLKGKRLHHTKGVHLVVPNSRLPLKQSVYFDTADGRMVFAIPRGKTTYIGTTDTEYKDLLEEPHVTRKDVDYLLRAVNRIFPEVQLTVHDISSSWAGLRPLIHQDGKSPSELSRKDEIFIAPSGLISIAGGKLTGYRMMAKRITDLVMHKLEKEEHLKYKKCITPSICLSGGEFAFTHALDAFADSLFAEVSDTGIARIQIKDLTHKYGSHTKDILKKFPLYILKNNDVTLALVFSELSYCIENEMVVSLNDFLIRRSGRLYFERETLSYLAPMVLEEMGEILNWNEADKKRNWETFEKKYREAVTFV